MFAQAFQQSRPGKGLSASQELGEHRRFGQALAGHVAGGAETLARGRAKEVRRACIVEWHRHFMRGGARHVLPPMGACNPSIFLELLASVRLVSHDTQNMNCSLGRLGPAALPERKTQSGVLCLWSQHLLKASAPSPDIDVHPTPAHKHLLRHVQPLLQRRSYLPMLCLRVERI